MRCSHTAQRLKISVDDGLCVKQGGKVDLTVLSLKSLSMKENALVMSAPWTRVTMCNMPCPST